MPREIELKLDRSTSVFYLPASKAEVKFIYRETFRNDCYFQHGIHLNEGDVVVDAGANIGLFALRALRVQKRIHYFGFEPVPAIFHCLEKNLSRLAVDKGTQIRIFRQGLSYIPRESEITFYARMPGNSTLYPDEKLGDQRAIAQSLGLREVLRWHKGWFFLFLLIYPFLNPLMKWNQRQTYRKAERIKCAFTTIDRFVRDFQIRHIDLLKIDVEGSEIDILKGTSDDNLRRVRQIVMEIAPGNKREIANLKARLTRCGFRKIHLENMGPVSDPYTDALPCNLYALK